MTRVTHFVMGAGHLEKSLVTLSAVSNTGKTISQEITYLSGQAVKITMVNNATLDEIVFQNAKVTVSKADIVLKQYAASGLTFTENLTGFYTPVKWTVDANTRLIVTIDPQGKLKQETELILPSAVQALKTRLETELKSKGILVQVALVDGAFEFSAGYPEGSVPASGFVNMRFSTDPNGKLDLNSFQGAYKLPGSGELVDLNDARLLFDASVKMAIDGGQLPNPPPAVDGWRVALLHLVRMTAMTVTKCASNTTHSGDFPF
jgi:hypothetical protein